MVLFSWDNENGGFGEKDVNHTLYIYIYNTIYCDKRETVVAYNL